MCALANDRRSIELAERLRTHRSLRDVHAIERRQFKPIATGIAEERQLVPIHRPTKRVPEDVGTHIALQLDFLAVERGKAQSIGFAVSKRQRLIGFRRVYACLSRECDDIVLRRDAPLARRCIDENALFSASDIDQAKLAVRTLREIDRHAAVEYAGSRLFALSDLGPFPRSDRRRVEFDTHAERLFPFWQRGIE